MNDLPDMQNRLRKLLLKKDARAAGIDVPVTTSITLAQAMRGGYDQELLDAANAGRRAALVLVCGSIERRGMVQLWAEKAKTLVSPCRDYAELGGSPSQSGASGKPRRALNPSATAP